MISQKRWQILIATDKTPSSSVGLVHQNKLLSRKKNTEIDYTELWLDGFIFSALIKPQKLPKILRALRYLSTQVHGGEFFKQNCVLCAILEAIGVSQS